MFGSCATDGCDKSTTMLSGYCRFHNVIQEARWLSPDDFDRARKMLATAAPVTQDERNISRARSALRSVEWGARDLKRARRDARKAGATDSQIADAIKRGKAGVS